MQPWQNYSMNNNPAYQQSMYQPMQNPYLDNRYANLQQYQQSISPTQMSGTSQFAPLGKIVDSVDIVKATDIPMDGNPYYFPKADGSEVYMKRWLPNGTTETIAYKPILDQKDTQAYILSSDEEKLKFEEINSVLGGIQEDIRMLSDKMDKISKPSRAKKEVAEDE